MRKVLIVVDPQNDFVKPDGKLAIPNAEVVIPKINNLMNSAIFDFIIITQDWHPSNHVSFASTYGAAPFTQKETLQGAGSKAGIKTINQVMWPDHCVMLTDGAAIHGNIEHERANAILRKGNIVDRECYSVFEYVYVNDGKVLVFGDEYITPHFLMVDGLKAEEIYICGYATDFCVQSTAISATRLARKVSVIMDACAPVDQGNLPGVCSKFQELGINMVTEQQVFG